MSNAVERAILAIVALSCAAGVPTWGAHDEPPREEASSRADFGRVLYAEDGVTLLRAPTEDRPGARDEATINAPVFPGDALITDRRARAEVQLAGGTFVRLDEQTKLIFQSLPDPYADVPDTTLLQLEAGVLQLSVRLAESEEFRVDTPYASLFLLTDGDVRVEVGREQTQVFSRRGVVEVVGQTDSVLLRGGTRTTVDAGEAPEEPRPFNTFARDGFDRWVEARMEAWAYRDASIYEDDDLDPYDELPYEVRPYYRELRRYGRWIWYEPYGYCWYPYGAGPGWRPYADGYWVYGPTGYFWVSYEPWGWAPYHYGRWVWLTGYGWAWVPGRVFSGAWVSWVWTVDYVGWCPLDYWNRPAFIFTVHFGYFDPHVWVFVPYHRFHHRHLHDHVVPFDHVRDHVTRTAVVTRPPRVPPERLAQDPELRRRVVEDLSQRNRETIRPVRVTRPDVAEGPSFREDERRIVREGRARPARPGVPTGEPAERDERGRPVRPDPGGPRTPDRPRSLSPRPQAPPFGGDWSRSGQVERSLPGEVPSDDSAERGRPARPVAREGQPREPDNASPDRLDRDRVRDFYRTIGPSRRREQGGDEGRQGAGPEPRPAPPAAGPGEGSGREPAPRQDRAQPRKEAPSREPARASPERDSQPKSSARSRGSDRRSRGKDRQD